MRRDSKLSREARMLVSAGRRLYLPSTTETDRVHTRLVATIALPAGIAAATAARTASAAGASTASFLSGTAFKVFGSALALAAAVGVGVLARRDVTAPTASVSVRPFATTTGMTTATTTTLTARLPGPHRSGPASGASLPPVMIQASGPPSTPRVSDHMAATRSAMARSDRPRVAFPAAPIPPPTTEHELPAIALAPAVAPVVAAEPAPAPASADPVAAVAVEPQPPVEGAPRPRSRGDLFDEQRLIHTARTAMVTGHPDDALAALDRHAQQFPRGLLRDARRAERVLVLCQLHRTREARIEAEALLRRTPVGPYADIARGSCARPD